MFDDRERALKYLQEQNASRLAGQPSEIRSMLELLPPDIVATWLDENAGKYQGRQSSDELTVEDLSPQMREQASKFNVSEADLLKTINSLGGKAHLKALEQDFE